MLRLSRRNVYRFTSSYVCASCLTTAHTPSILSRRSALASHHARPLSTTVACDQAAVTEAKDGAADAKVETVVLPPPTAKNKKKASSPKKNKNSDADRQLKVLEGALAALKKVLVEQGVDVSKVLQDANKSIASTPTPPQNPKSAAPQPAPAAKKAKQPEKAAPSNPPKKSKALKRIELKAKANESKPGRSDARILREQLTKEVEAEMAENMAKNASKEGVSKPADLGVPFEQMVSVRKVKSSTGLNIGPLNPTSVNRIRPDKLSFVPIETDRPEVPALSYGLDRVLFNPGVYQIQCPRSKVYNFDPYLSQIMPVKEFDFNALKQYVTSSKDNTLINIAKDNKKKYTGSTSSMTSMLAHFHYLLSKWRDINVSMLSKRFKPDSLQPTRILKAPAAIFLHWKDGTYAIDADKEFDTANILSMLGKSMEKLLTLSKEDYERYRHGNSDQISEEERNAEEAYHYTGFQDFMMRSQLDAHDSRMPGSGMFDLKTRAVISIRMDARGYEKGLGYEIRQKTGQWESFEREYYDMIRSAFLKYSLQVRMGRMDGIFVAFHNTQRIFGFQYISLNEMDTAIHGTDDLRVGDQEFKASLTLLNEILDRATKKWPEQSLRIHFETRDSKSAPFMYIFAKPTTPEEITAVQDANKASVEEFERNMLGLVKKSEGDETESKVETATVAEDAVAKDSDDGTLSSTQEIDDLADYTVKKASDDVTPPSTQETASLTDNAAEKASDDVTLTPAQETDSSIAWHDARRMVEEAIGDDELGIGLVREAIGDALEQSGILQAKSVAESREYVDALIGALTGRTPSVQEDASAVESNEDETVKDEDEEVAQQSEEALDQSSLSELSQSESTPESADSTQTLEVEAAESKSDIEEKTPGEGIAPANLEALKSLIMQMVREVEETDGSETDVESANDDASKLKAFERILGRLISPSKIERADDGVVDEDEGVESESRTSEANVEASTKSKLSDNEIRSSRKGKKEPPEEPHELLAMTLTIKNRLDNAYVDRVDDLSSGHKWTVEYELEEMSSARGHNLYKALKSRRQKVLQDDGNKDEEWYKMFAGSLATYTNKGRQYRQQEEAREKKQPLHMVGADEPLHYKDVFGRGSQSEAIEEASEEQSEAASEVSEEQSTAPSEVSEEESQVTTDEVSEEQKKEE